MPIYRTEMERIRAGEAWARQQMESNPDAVAQFGESCVLSDLTHYFLMNSAPSEELAKQTGLMDEDEDTEDEF